LLSIDSIVSPMLSYPSKAFDSREFLYEIKYDGTRGLCYVKKKENSFRLLNVKKRFFEDKFPDLSNIVKSVNAKNAIIDGEVVVFDKNGIADFNLTMTRDLNSQKAKTKLLADKFPAVYVAFDIILKDGKDLTNKPLEERKRILNETLEEGDNIMISKYVIGNGINFFKAAGKNGLEGIMAKKINSKYYPGTRSREWLKIKHNKTIDCFIIGITKSGSLQFGALLAAAYRNGRPIYIGKVGTGFDDKIRKIVFGMAMKNKTKRPVVDEEEIPQVVKEEIQFYTKPIVMEIEGLLITKNLQVRAPSFKRLRFDKNPKECTLLIGSQQ